MTLYRPPLIVLRALPTAALLLLLAAVSETAWSATLHVPTQYASIQAAINAADDGDIIFVAPGTYHENLTLNKSITLRAETYDADDPRHNTTIIDGGGSTVFAIPAGLTPGPTLVGFVIRNGQDGISPRSPMTVEYTYFTGSGDQIDYEKGSGGICRYNVFENAGDDAIDLDHSIADLVIEHNIMRQSGNDGIEIRLHDDTIAEQVKIVIRHNEISGSQQDGIQFIDYYQHTNRLFIIDRNLILNNGKAGIGMMDDTISNEDFRAANITELIHVFNNTFVGNDHGISGGDNLIALNNIFQDHVLALKQVDGDSIASYNLFWSNLTDSQASNGDNSTTLYADALLDDQYQLQAGSLAIDAGAAHFEWQGEVVLDMASSTYAGAAPDLGWKESDFSGPPATPTPTETPQDTATPTKMPTATRTSTPSHTATLTLTATPRATAMATSTSTVTGTPTATATQTPTAEPTSTGAESHVVFLPVVSQK